jgi:hypothetical protein
MDVLSILESNFRRVSIPAGCPKRKNPGRLARVSSLIKLPGDVSAAGQDSPEQADNSYD